MITLAKLTELLGWMSILNIGVLFFVSILLVTMKTPIIAIHSKMFAIPENELSTCYFNYLANYKTFTFIFIITPYLALKIMGQ